MGNKLDNREENFCCIYGNLDDIICANDLGNLTFHRLLNDYLRDVLGYEMILFYTSRGVRVYDRNSAKLALCANAEDEEIPEDYDEDDEPLVFENEPGYASTEEEEFYEEEDGIVYNDRMEPERFLELMERELRSTERKSAIVFEDIMDYVRADAELQDEITETLHFFQTDATDENENKLIFLALHKTLNQIYSDLNNSNCLVLRDLFFHVYEDGWDRTEGRFVEFMYPGLDEIGNLLERYRLLGYKGSRFGVHRKYLDYPVAKLRDLAYDIHGYGAGRESLKQVGARLKQLMEKSPSDVIWMDKNVVDGMYPSVEGGSHPQDELQRLDASGQVSLRMGCLRKEWDASRTGKGKLELARWSGERDFVWFSNSRFLLSGREGTDRLGIARAMAHNLYLIGEVSVREPYVVTEQSLMGLQWDSLERSIRLIFHQARGRVLVFNQLDTLLTWNGFGELKERQQFAKAFQENLQRELRQDNRQHFILVINTAWKDAFFGETFDQYQIPEENIFELGDVDIPVLQERDLEREER